MNGEARPVRSSGGARRGTAPTRSAAPRTCFASPRALVAQVALGDKVTKKYKLECKVPIDFEFEIAVTKPNASFQVRSVRWDGGVGAACHAAAVPGQLASCYGRVSWPQHTRHVNQRNECGCVGAGGAAAGRGAGARARDGRRHVPAAAALHANHGVRGEGGGASANPNPSPDPAQGRVIAQTGPAGRAAAQHAGPKRTRRQRQRAVWGWATLTPAPGQRRLHQAGASSGRTCASLYIAVCVCARIHTGAASRVQLAARAVRGERRRLAGPGQGAAARRGAGRHHGPAADPKAGLGRRRARRQRVVRRGGGSQAADGPHHGAPGRR